MENISNILIDATFSWDGSSLPDYPTGQPEIIIKRITFPAGHKTEWHLHKVINAGVILSGELTVVCKNGKEKTFRAGEPIVECVGEIHRGENRGSVPTELIMFYASTPGLPIETKAD